MEYYLASLPSSSPPSSPSSSSSSGTSFSDIELIVVYIQHSFIEKKIYCKYVLKRIHPASLITGFFFVPVTRIDFLFGSSLPFMCYIRRQQEAFIVL